MASILFFIFLAVTLFFFARLWKKQRKIFALTLLLGLLSMCTGAWGIFQSRSSTAAIGIIFLIPFTGFICIFYALFSTLANDPTKITKNPTAAKKFSLVFRGLSFLFWFFPMWLVLVGFQTIQKNNLRDVENKKQAQLFQDEKIALQSELKLHQQDRNAWLNQKIHDAADDYIKLQALAELTELNSEHIDLLFAKHSHFGWWPLASKAATTPEQMRRMFAMAPKFDYSIVELAKNPRLPADLVQKIFELRSTNRSIAYYLMTNPQTTPEMLKVLQEESEKK